LGPVGARLGTPAEAARTPLRPVTATGTNPAPEAAAAPETAAPALEIADDFVPAHRFDQAFTVAHPPDAVFALFGDVEAVATCLPGAVLTGRPSPEMVEGALQVRIGPIAARFRGRARIFRDAPSRSGRILGAGSDAGGRSATQGEIRYRVGPGEAPGTAKVDLAVGYTLKGPLAQFGRPGLVRDLAGRLGAEFAANLEARLSGAPAPPAAGLNPLRWLLAALVAPLRRRLAARGARRP
ncbi:MAG: SRPBCC family protein, partial [Methylobacterium sp.]|uniref:SRPBCC family protein n=1 Tax=Methylobacterium sp. TaxID=409 RepID=UPI00271D7A9F